MSLLCRVIKGGLCEQTQGYKPNQHYGLDLVSQGYKVNDIVAHSDGVVVKVRNNCNKTYSTGAAAVKEWGDAFGNYVMIDHQNGFFTQYEHLAYGTVKVKIGEKVKKGQVIGYMGNTGYSKGAHLHWQVNKSQQWNDVVNPAPYLNSDFATMPQPEKRNELTNQLQVLVEQLRVRTEPNTNAAILGFAVEDAIYNHLETKVSGGYTWYKLANKAWIADNGSWIKLLPKKSEEEMIKELEEKLLIANETIGNLEEKIATQEETIKLLEETGLKLNQENTDLKVEHAQLTEEVKSAEKQLNVVVKENENLKKQLANVKTNHQVILKIGNYSLCKKID